MDISSVLLIDDERDIRTVAELALTAVGQWDTRLASSGREGIELARQRRPDVILLDVMMPDMDGPETLKHLKQDPATSDVPVIFMTAKVQRHEVEQYLELGATGVIAKPFDPMQLSSEVSRLVADL